MKINKQKFIEVLVILLLSLTPILWLQQNQVVLGHDSGFRLETLSHLSHLFYSWNPITNFGTDWSHLKGFLVMQFPEIFFTLLTHSLTYGQIITFILWFFVIGISMYIFANNFFSERRFWILRMLSSIFYMYNFFLLQGWFIAERAKFSLFAALPLGILITFNTLTRKISVIKGTILFSFLFLFLNGGGSPPLYGSVFLSFGFLFLFLTLFQVKKNGFSEIFFSLRVVLSFILGTLAINAYLIVPQIYFAFHSYSTALSSIGGISGIIAWETVVSKYASFINLFRLQGVSDWYQNPVHPYANTFINNPFLIAGSFVPILIILFGLFFRDEKNKSNNLLLYFMLLLLLFGLLFTAGSHPPLGFFYLFCLKYVPGFLLFRSAFYKFAPVAWFVIIFLFGYFTNKFAYTSTNRFVNIGVGIVALIFILTYHFPYFIGTFFNWNPPYSTRVTVPDYVYQMSQYINTTSKNTDRILVYPPLDSHFHADTYSWGFWSLDLLPRTSIDRSILADDDASIIATQIYKAISLQDYDSFSRLTHIAGINKILLRNDVKTIKESEDQGLALLPGVVLEKKIGEWLLYEIPLNKDSLVTVPDSIEYADGDNGLNYILSSGLLTKNSAIIFSNQNTFEAKSQLTSYPSRTLEELHCIYCEIDKFDQLINNITMPTARILPDSPLYSLISFKEKQQLKRSSSSRSSLMDTSIALSSKRIAELGGFIIAEKEGSEQYVAKTIQKYMTEITQAITIADGMPGIEKNDAYIRILGYMNAQNRYLSTIDNRKRLAENDFETLIEYMGEKIHYLESHVWMTSDPKKIRYIFTIEEEGIYSLSISQEEVQPQKIILDGEEIANLTHLVLQKDTHTLELIYPESASVVDLSVLPDNKIITLGFGQKIQFPIKNYQKNSIYAISFDYRFLDGKPPFFSFISQNSNADPVNQKIRLEPENSGRTFHFTAKSGPQDNNAAIEFFANGFGRRISSLFIDNFKVVKTYVPHVYVYHDSNTNSFVQLPTVSSEKINDSLYSINVSNATSPFLLEFNQSFNKEWKAYVLPSTIKNSQIKDTIITFQKKALSESNHLVTNGLENGWVVNQGGSYTIILAYAPQNIFYGACLISIITIIWFGIRLFL